VGPAVLRHRYSSTLPLTTDTREPAGGNTDTAEVALRRARCRPREQTAQLSEALIDARWPTRPIVSGYGAPHLGRRHRHHQRLSEPPPRSQPTEYVVRETAIVEKVRRSPVETISPARAKQLFPRHAVAVESRTASVKSRDGLFLPWEKALPSSGVGIRGCPAVVRWRARVRGPAWRSAAKRRLRSNRLFRATGRAGLPGRETELRMPTAPGEEPGNYFETDGRRVACPASDRIPARRRAHATRRRRCAGTGGGLREDERPRYPVRQRLRYRLTGSVWMIAEDWQHHPDVARMASNANRFSCRRR
jgi:hypothetical protein